MAEAIRMQMMAGRNGVFGSPATLDGAVQMNRDLGIVSGLQLALTIPEALITDYESDIDQLKLEDNPDGTDDHASDTDSDSPSLPTAPGI